MENFAYLFVKSFGAFVRFLPIGMALAIGRFIGRCVYYFDVKHRSLSYGNLKLAFAKTKSPRELKKINKKLYTHFGQNIIELLRLPLMNAAKFKEHVKLEGEEHVVEATKKGKGVILLAMHFGSWELASLSCAMFNHQYKVVVKPQKKFSKLYDLLNSYRTCGGNVVIARGLGTREIVKSLKNNEVIGLVVDQGGKDGMLVPFFGRRASMSVGALRIALKYDVPVCFSIIIRDKGVQHKMIIEKPLELTRTGDVEEDLLINLTKITNTLENYITQYPHEYMWFYKIWKYSKEATIVILNDGKTGHLRQSQTVAKMLKTVLKERDVSSTIQTIPVLYKNNFTRRSMSLITAVVNSFIYQGRLEILKWFLTKESFHQIMSTKADFIISCGSSVSGINCFLSNDQKAKSVVILKPGLLSRKRFDLVILPQHDYPYQKKGKDNVLVTKGAANLIDDEYLRTQVDALLNHYSHLKASQRKRIGILLGGDTKEYFLSEKDVRVAFNQIKEISEQINADILVTTSRRTSHRIENLVQHELKQHPHCQLYINANKNNVPEAIGGILGLSDIVVVSGDSISMISEAASSGKKTIVFPVQLKDRIIPKQHKHVRFIEELNNQGYIISTDVKSIGQTISNVTKNKIQTQRLSDRDAIKNTLRYLI